MAHGPCALPHRRKHSTAQSHSLTVSRCGPLLPAAAVAGCRLPAAHCCSYSCDWLTSTGRVLYCTYVAAAAVLGRQGSGSLGGHIHGHPWDPEYRYRYSNGVMRSGHLAIAFQLREVRKDWGGFGIIPGSHKVNYPLPAELRSTSLTSIIPPLVSPAAPMGSLLIFFESALHTSLPWYGPPGTERRSLLFRIAPMHSSHRSGLGTHWGGSWTYEAKQPQWVEDELTPEQQEVLSAPRGNLASTFPTAPEGTSISGGALIRDEPEPETEPEPEQEEEGEEAVSTQQLDYRYISGRHGYRPRG